MTPVPLKRLLDRVRRSLFTWPTSRDWLELLAAAAVLAMIAGPAGMATGLLSWAPQGPGVLAASAVTVFFVPALGEELLFRGPWIPGRDEARRPLWPILGSTAAFVLWHVLETTWLPKAAPLFLRPDFLAWAALLGIACAALRYRSGSLWPPVILHWAAVVAWETWLGGPAGIAALR